MGGCHWFLAFRAKINVISSLMLYIKRPTKGHYATVNTQALN